MRLQLIPNANDTITPHAIFAFNGPMVARTVTIADAEYIVTACNAHDKLVEALREIACLSDAETADGQAYRIAGTALAVIGA